MSSIIDATTERVLAAALAGWYVTETEYCTTWRHPSWRWVVVVYGDAPDVAGLVRVTRLNRLYRNESSTVLEDPVPRELPRLLRRTGAPDVKQPRYAKARPRVEAAA